jgi:hypothetical protein
MWTFSSAFSLMTITNKSLEPGIWNMVIVIIHLETNLVIIHLETNLVSPNFDVICDKFNVDKIYMYLRNKFFTKVEQR